MTFEVKFRLFKPDEEMQLLNWRDASEQSKLSDGTVNFLAHGYLETYDNSAWMNVRS